MISRFFFKNNLNFISIKKKNNIISKYYNSSNILNYSLGRACLYHILKTEIKNHKNEIITTPLTLPSIINIIKLTKAKIKFVDINLHTGLPIVSDLKKKINSKTSLILITHLYSDKKTLMKISSLKKRNSNFKIIEDVAINFGLKKSNKKITNLNADYSFFSFNFMKNFHSIVGGALLIKDRKFLNILKKEQSEFKNFSNFLLFKLFFKYLIINFITQKILFSFIFFYFFKYIELKNIQFLKKKIYPGYFNELNSKKLLYYKKNNLGQIFFPTKILEIKNDIKERLNKSEFFYKNLKSNKNLIVFNPKEVDSINLEYLVIIKKNFKNLYNYLLNKKIYLRKHWYKNNNSKFKNSEFVANNALLLPTHNKIKESEINHICETINNFYETL